MIVPVRGVWYGKLLEGTAKWRSILAQSLKKWKQPKVPKRETSLSCRQNRDQKNPTIAVFFFEFFIMLLENITQALFLLTVNHDIIRHSQVNLI